MRRIFAPGLSRADQASAIAPATRKPDFWIWPRYRLNQAHCALSITTSRAGHVSVNPNRPQYDKPRLQDALVLLASSAVCASLFYLFTGNVTESLVDRKSVV